MIRVLLVDDQSVVKRTLRVRFHLEPDLEVVGEASTGKEALSLAQALTPDVVLMDLLMPEMDGIQATAALRRVVPQSVIVILSIHFDAQTRRRAQAAGAVAFIEKRGATDTLSIGRSELAVGDAQNAQDRPVRVRTRCLRC